MNIYNLKDIYREHYICELQISFSLGFSKDFIVLNFVKTVETYNSIFSETIMFDIGIIENINNRDEFIKKKLISIFDGIHHKYLEWEIQKATS